MAQEYIALETQSDVGQIAVNKQVIESIIDITIDDVSNASRVHTKRFSKPIQVRIDQNKLLASVDILVKNTANVHATCALLQNKIYENIEYMTGISPTYIGVNVVGFEL